MNLDKPTAPLTILFETHKYNDPGHHWQMAAIFRKVFLESQNNFIFINPSAYKAREQDSKLLSGVGEYTYINVASGQDFYPEALSEVHKIVENIGDRNGVRHLFWGMKKVNGEWIGENTMGKILMDLREEYKEEKMKG